MTANEEKELRRVYDYLANFSPKHKLRKRMQPLLDRRYKIMQYKKNPDAIRIVDESGVELSSEHLEAELAHINTEVDSLQAQIGEIDGDPTKKIQATDLMDALRALGKECTKVRPKLNIFDVAYTVSPLMVLDFPRLDPIRKR